MCNLRNAHVLLDVGLVLSSNAFHVPGCTRGRDDRTKRWCLIPTIFYLTIRSCRVASKTTKENRAHDTASSTPAIPRASYVLNFPANIFNSFTPKRRFSQRQPWARLDDGSVRLSTCSRNSLRLNDSTILICINLEWNGRVASCGSRLDNIASKFNTPPWFKIPTTAVAVPSGICTRACRL
ncbi:hypothetical protein K438DRAFT_390504 [Mycena galopus ATCC 62051]|nr:hypothetical protein K438DRAFT_390504 [Mycena galopus ATCC 62051]